MYIYILIYEMQQSQQNQIVSHPQYIHYMNLQKIAYHLHRPPPAYCRMTGQAEERDLRNERLQEFKRLLVNRRIRKPKQVIEKIKKTIRLHIYQMSLEELIEKLKIENVEYDEDLIDSETRVLYQQIIKSDQVKMIQEEPTILQFDRDSSPIKNKRKLEYQSDVSKVPINYEVFKSEMINERMMRDNILRIENELNQQLKVELLNENIKFKPIDIIEERDQFDPISFVEFQNLKRKKEELAANKEKELSTFREDHIITSFDSQDPSTSRSQMEILEEMLKCLVDKNISFAERTTVRPIKIRKNILEDLINFQGKLKKDIINKVLVKIKKDNNIK